ncbi:MAG: transposase, partial [Sandaracinaceae bacterium]|nr:transposase [Sandaracinaceae bacterium]
MLFSTRATTRTTRSTRCSRATRLSVADAHVVYDHLYERGDIVEVNCWAHSRRYFFKAMASDPERAGQALLHAGGCCSRSSAASGRAPQEARSHPAESTRRLSSNAFLLVRRRVGARLEDTPMYAALRSPGTSAWACSSFSPTAACRSGTTSASASSAGRPVGRKNWLFVGSDDAAHVNAAFTSRSSPAAAGSASKPWEYLRDLFCLLPAWPSHRVLELAPAYWAGTREREDVVAMLAADPYRAATRALGARRAEARSS